MLEALGATNEAIMRAKSEQEKAGAEREMA